MLFYLTILSCTVLCDPNPLQLLNPCLISIIKSNTIDFSSQVPSQVEASVQTEESLLLVKHY